MSDDSVTVEQISHNFKTRVVIGQQKEKETETITKLKLNISAFITRTRKWDDYAVETKIILIYLS